MERALPANKIALAYQSYKTEIQQRVTERGVTPSMPRGTRTEYGRTGAEVGVWGMPPCLWNQILILGWRFLTSKAVSQHGKPVFLSTEHTMRVQGKSDYCNCKQSYFWHFAPWFGYLMAHSSQTWKLRNVPCKFKAMNWEALTFTLVFNCSS